MLPRGRTFRTAIMTDHYKFVTGVAADGLVGPAYPDPPLRDCR
jgi:hypothetical protein